jgi:AcrR family transcriptional regulator
MSDRDAVHQAQRARLLEGLAQSVREKGLAQTQVTDIVRHARASRRTFYNHFDDKDAAFVALATELGQTLQHHVEQAIDLDAPPEEQVATAIETYVDALMSDPAMTITFASPSLGERIVMAQREGFERFANLLVAVTKAGAERNDDLAPVSFQRAYMVITGVHQSIIRALARGDDLKALTPELTAFMQAVVLAEPAPAPPAPKRRRRMARAR